MRKVFYYLEVAIYLKNGKFCDFHNAQSNFDKKSCRDNEMSIFEPNLL